MLLLLLPLPPSDSASWTFSCHLLVSFAVTNWWVATAVNSCPPIMLPQCCAVIMWCCFCYPACAVLLSLPLTNCQPLFLIVITVSNILPSLSLSVSSSIWSNDDCKWTSTSFASCQWQTHLSTVCLPIHFLWIVFRSSYNEQQEKTYSLLVLD